MNTLKENDMIVTTLTIKVPVTLSEYMVDRAIIAINKAVTGRWNISKLDNTGTKIVPLNPPDVSDALHEAHTNVRRTIPMNVIVDIDENGNLLNPRFLDHEKDNEKEVFEI